VLRLGLAKSLSIALLLPEECSYKTLCSKVGVPSTRKRQLVEPQFPTAIMTSFGPTEIERQLLANWDVLIVELDPIDRDKSMDEFWEALG